MGNLRIFIVAGEASGDIHGAAAAERIFAARPGAEIIGVGGPTLRAAGAKTIVDSKSIAVVGLTEVLRHRHEISAAFGKVYASLEHSPPDLAILIDSPGFNFRIARQLVRKRIPILYYISPQVWAWHRSRLGEMKKWSKKTDFRMAVVFPFEEQLYIDAGIPVNFVGHPLLDRLDQMPPARQLRREFGLDPDRPVVAILPGSRRIEIERMAPPMLAAARLLRTPDRRPQFLLPVAKTLDPVQLQRIKNEVGANVLFVDQDERFRAIAAADAAMVASGTATVEVGLMKTPMVIAYQTNFLTYSIGKLVLQTMRGMTNIGMVNILLGEPVAPELIQDRLTPENLAAEVSRFLDEPDYASATRTKLGELSARLGRGGAAAEVAAIAIEMAERKH